MGHWRAASLALALAAALVAAHPTESSRATPTRDAIAGSRRPRHSHRCGTHDPEPESLDRMKRFLRDNPDCNGYNTAVTPDYSPTNSQYDVRVVVHVMTCGNEGKLGTTTESEACINGQMMQLNAGFSGNIGQGEDSGFRFTLAGWDEIDDCSAYYYNSVSDDYYGRYNWDATKYANVFLHEADGFLGWVNGFRA